jgi:hypothetical protein
MFPDGRGSDRMTTIDGARAVADDFSQVAPVEIVSSSDGRGWRGPRVMSFRHTTGEIDVPPFTTHAVIVHLGPPVAAGTLLAVLQVGGITGRIGWGAISDRAGRRKPVMVLAGALAIPCCLAPGPRAPGGKLGLFLAGLDRTLRGPGRRVGPDPGGGHGRGCRAHRHLPRLVRRLAALRAAPRPERLSAWPSGAWFGSRIRKGEHRASIPSSSSERGAADPVGRPRRVALGHLRRPDRRGEGRPGTRDRGHRRRLQPVLHGEQRIDERLFTHLRGRVILRSLW